MLFSIIIKKGKVAYLRIVKYVERDFYVLNNFIIYRKDNDQ